MSTMTKPNTARSERISSAYRTRKRSEAKMRADYRAQHRIQTGKRSTAIHEAAHAVATVLAGEHIHEVHIRTSAQLAGDDFIILNRYQGMPRRTLGSMDASFRVNPGTLKYFPPGWVVPRSDIMDQLIIFAAGPVAQARGSYRSVRSVIARGGGQNDLESMRELAEFVGDDAMVDEALAHAREFVGQHWTLIREVADLILLNGDRTDGEAIHELIETRIGRVPAFRASLVL